MTKFTIPETELPFAFFDEIGVSYIDIALGCLRDKFVDSTPIPLTEILEKYDDLITQKLFKLKNSTVLNDYFVREIEADDSSGTWGYSEFEILDLEKVKFDVSEKIKLLINEVLESEI